MTDRPPASETQTTSRRQASTPAEIAAWWEAGTGGGTETATTAHPDGRTTTRVDFLTPRQTVARLIAQRIGREITPAEVDAALDAWTRQSLAPRGPEPSARHSEVESAFTELQETATPGTDYVAPGLAAEEVDDCERLHATFSSMETDSVRRVRAFIAAMESPATGDTRVPSRCDRLDRRQLARTREARCGTPRRGGSRRGAASRSPGGGSDDGPSDEPALGGILAGVAR